MVKIIQQVHCIVIALYGTYKQLYAISIVHVQVQASLVINNGIQNQKV